MNHKKKVISIIENLNKVKFQVIFKSKQLIDIIQMIATIKLSFIQKTIDFYEIFLKTGELNEQMLNQFKQYENIEILNIDLDSFIRTANKSFSIFNGDTEIIDPEIENLLNDKKFKSQKTLKKTQNIQNQQKLKKLKKSPE